MIAESGQPDWNVPIACNCHPRVTTKRWPGNIYVPANASRCLISKSERPRSARRFCEFWGRMLIRVTSSIDLEKRYDAETADPDLNRRSTRTSPACAIEDPLVSN